MEAFSLLKYWKSANIVNGNGNAKQSVVSVITAVNNRHVAVSDEDDEDEDSVSDGPFFDLEFAVPDDVADDVADKEDVRVKVEGREIVYGEIEDDEEEREFTLQSEEDVEERVVHVDGSDAVAEMEEIIQTAFTGSKSGQFPVSLVKSATKLKVFMSGLKRSKSESKQISNQSNGNGQNSNSKLLRVRLKMEEVKMPIISLLTRVKSTTKEEDEKSVITDNKTVLQESDGYENNERKKNNNKKEVVERYLKLVRPLYVKISKKNNSDTAVDTAEEVAVAEKRGKRRLSLNVKNLGKSKSAVVHSMSPSNGNGNGNARSLLASKKSNSDWLLQQQDGIQGAILHCKRSFNSSSSSEGGDETTSVLIRSASDPSHEKKLVAGAEEERNGVVDGPGS